MQPFTVNLVFMLPKGTVAGEIEARTGRGPVALLFPPQLTIRVALRRTTVAKDQPASRIGFERVKLLLRSMDIPQGSIADSATILL